MAGAPSSKKHKAEGGEKEKTFRPFSKKQGEEKVLTKLPTLIEATTLSSLRQHCQK
jgi:hypothetical protein